jgi:hypothetical protein
MNEIPSLAGKTLGCWCKPNPCHGDVLVKLVSEYLQTEEFEVLPDVDEADDICISEDSKQMGTSQCNKPTSSVPMEGVTIGATYIKRPYVCVMAISGGHLIRPLLLTRIKKSDRLATIGTKFGFTYYDMERMKTFGPPHSHEDAPISITWIDQNPADAKQLHRVVASCAVSKIQVENSQKLVHLLASSQRDAKKTPYVIEGSNVNSSIIIKVENDVVLYYKTGRKLRAQIRVLGNDSTSL